MSTYSHPMAGRARLAAFAAWVACALAAAPAVGQTNQAEGGERAAPAPAPDPAPAPALPRNVQLAKGLADRVAHWESVEMLTAILRGSQMGPADGWFHPGKSRYGPHWLAAHFDANHDNTVTPEEFLGPPELFERLDRDRSGVLTIDDFDWSEQSSYYRELAVSSRLVSLMDAGSNGRISKQEWLEFFEKAAKDKSYLTPEDLRLALRPPRPRPQAEPPSTDRPTMATLLTGLLKGEVGSLLEGPAIDQPAPGFTLKTEDGKKTISLADYRGKTPVVLVFGSFT